MSDMWKQWEGQVADHKYQLQRYLGSTDHSVVFLAESHDPEPRQVAIKFVSADIANRDQQIAAWNNTAQLNHPNLIRIHGAGLCRIEDMDLLYVATEYAEENLAQVLPHRALTADETREMLNAVSDVLFYLHSKNFTHGHIKPSNILAHGDLLKLSADTIYPVGEPREMRRERSSYDAPELPDSPYTPAADVWSFGVTLVEAFTQQPAVLPFNERAEPIIPAAMRPPFLEIARNTLRRDPALRWTSATIAERLNPAAAARSVAAGAGSSARSAAVSAAVHAAIATSTPSPTPVATLSPLDVSLSHEPAVPLAKQPYAPATRTPAHRTPPREEGVPPQTVVLPNYAIPLFAGLLVLIALILLPFVFGHRGARQVSAAKPQQSAPLSAKATPPQSAPATNSTPSDRSASAVSSPPATPSEPKPSPASTTSAAVAPASDNDVQPPAGKLSSPPPATPSPKVSGGSASKGDVLDQVEPQASAKALSTIQGTVRVGVKVHVDAAGNVSEATLDNAGPSHYFADLALNAARRWVFTPPEADGHSVASDWLIQFHFTHSGVQSTPQQLAP